MNTCLETNDPPSPPPAGLVDAKELLTALWPNPQSRPCLRWLRTMQARRAIPFLKIGHRVFFEPDRVRMALRKFEVKPALFA
jgi:hypothetical protein